jgi:chemotaxis signal transduction protein
MTNAGLKELFHQQILESESADGPEIDKKIYLYFKYGEKNFCTPIVSVNEIIDFPSFVPSPVDIGNCLGVFNLRGNILPILDPDHYFLPIQDKLKSRVPGYFRQMKLRLIIFELSEGVIISLPATHVSKVEVADEDEESMHLTIKDTPYEKFDLNKFAVRLK